MNLRSFSPLFALSLALPMLAHADTITIAQDLNAPTSNFQNPGKTATTGYTIVTYGDGSSVIVSLHTNDKNALDFANLYFESVANDVNTGSNVGFEASGTAVNDAFIPSTGQKFSTKLPGFSSVEVSDDNGKTITVTIPDTFFTDDPDGIGFAKTPAGTNVSLHLSQSFGYSVVGGSDNFARPNELGLAEVDGVSATPEPSSLVLLGTGMLGAFGAARKKFMKA